MYAYINALFGVNFHALVTVSDIESKGERSSSAELKIRTQGLWNRISSRLNDSLILATIRDDT